VSFDFHMSYTILFGRIASFYTTSFNLLCSFLILQAEMRARKLKKDILNNKKEIELRLSKEDEKILKKEKEAKLNFDYEKAHRDSKVRFNNGKEFQICSGTG
jgi:hypothetical protein